MSTQPESSLEHLLGGADADVRRGLQDNAHAIQEHAGGDPVVFVGRGTASDGKNVDRNAFIYLTASVMGIAVNGAVVDGFPRKHITKVRPLAGDSVAVEAAPINSHYELRFDDAVTQARFLDAVDSR